MNIKEVFVQDMLNMRHALFGIYYLRIPVNQAYEDATGDLADVNMIEPYHFIGI